MKNGGIRNKDFENLIKENKNIKHVIWKEGLDNETIPETKMLEFLKVKGYKVPQILQSDDKKIIMEYVPGISVFQAMQYFYEIGHIEKIEFLANYLCEGVKHFQADTKKDLEKIIPYPASSKLNEVFQLLPIQNTQKSKNIINYIGKYYNKCASVIFRDATPKNYILKEVSTDDLSYMTNKEMERRIVWIDFSTTRYATLPADDFSSVLFHYMIPEKSRSKILSQYGVDFKNNLEIQIVIFVRLARFWIRRYYYKNYHPEKFKDRYSGEDITFYQKQFEDYLQLMYKML